MRSKWCAALCLLVAGPACAGDGGAVARLSHGLAVEESRSGAASPLLLPLLDRLAGAQFDDGDLAQAAAMRRRALTIALSAYGAGSANAAAAMTALAALDIERHRYLDAEPLLTVAATILPPGGAATADILAGQARIALARGEVKAAEAAAARAVAIADPSTEPLRALGAVYATEDRFADGERVLRQALARDRAEHGDASLEFARSAAQLANLLLRAKRFANALPQIEAAIAIDQARLGPNHPLIADDFCDLGLIYDGLKRDGDARAALTYAISLLNRGAGAETSRLAYAELELARVLRAEGDGAAAAIAFRDAHRILEAAATEERRRERQI